MEKFCNSRSICDLLKLYRRRNFDSRNYIGCLRNTSLATLSTGRIGKVEFLKFQRHLRQEVKALSSLYTRSGLLRTADHNSVAVALTQKSCFSTSSHLRSSGKENEEDDSNKKNENDGMEEVVKLMAKISVVIAVLGAFVILRPDDNLPSRQEIEIDWPTFEEKILKTGEAAYINLLVFPSKVKAYVTLHPDARIDIGTNVGVSQTSGKQIVLDLNCSGNEFIRKIRNAEHELGITRNEGLSVVRHDSTVSLQYIVMAGIVLFAMYRLRRYIHGSPRDTTSVNKDAKNHAQNNKPKPRKSAVDMWISEMSKTTFTRGDILAKTVKAVKMEEVAGLKQAKIEVMEFVDYLKSPERVTKLGGKHPRGVILMGPPGCGKTLLAKAVATEAGVPFFALAGSQFVEMVGGLGASRMRNLFEEAREKAPCIVFIDEIDAIGKKRTTNSSIDGGIPEEEHTLNQLLVELDGMDTTEGVIVMTSTNRPDILDKALLRPGRFDRRIEIDLPTLEDREEIFKIYLKKIKMKSDYNSLAMRLAQLTVGMTGADIANICNEAALHAARFLKDAVYMEDLDYAIERIVAGAAKKMSVITAAEKKVIAYHEAGHALVGWLLKNTDGLLKVTIVPRTSNILGFAQLAPKEHYLYSNEQLFERMCMWLGGRAAESIIFNHVTQGAHDDLDKVTKQAYNQIRRWGMNDTVGLVSFDYSSETLGAKPYSKTLDEIIDKEAQSLVARSYKFTQDLLIENKEKLHKLAEGLLEKETLSYEQVRELIGAPPHGDKIKFEEGTAPATPEKDKKLQDNV